MEGERRGAKHLQKPIFASPNWGDLEGRGGETNHLNTILIILT
jgi:hypothetical protein